MGKRSRKDDWAEFMTKGNVPLRTRPEIFESWKRSAQTTSSERKCAPLLRASELDVHHKHARRLRRGAELILREVGKRLHDSRDLFLLCDPAGVVIDTSGDPYTLAFGLENHLCLGGQWTEDKIGTNAIGTALHLHAPTIIWDAEHYCEAIQRWNCAAIPINDPGNNRMIGVADISWPVWAEQTNAIALIATIALQIETELGRIIAQEHESMLGELHTRRLRRWNEPVLLLDRYGADIYTTGDFTKFCSDCIDVASLRKDISRILDQSPNVAAEDLSARLGGVNFEVISQNGEAVGILLALHSQRKMVRRTQKSSSPSAELMQMAEVGYISTTLCAEAQRVVDISVPVLIEGETGTGKNHLAEAVHRASHQSDLPLELVHCTQLTERDLLRSLACEKTGTANSVLCLDRLDLISPPIQKLLLSLVEQELHRNTLIFSLSKQSLYDEMLRGTFRSDLYYRVAGTRLTLQPLRERRKEIPRLLRNLSQIYAKQNKKRVLRFTPGAVSRLNAYPWPGNLREMQNLIAALDLNSLNGLIDERSLPYEFRTDSERRSPNPTLRDTERATVLDAVEAENGNLSKAAKRLNIARSTLYLKLDSYGIIRKRASST